LHGTQNAVDCYSKCLILKGLLLSPRRNPLTSQTAGNELQLTSLREEAVSNVDACTQTRRVCKYEQTCLVWAIPMHGTQNKLLLILNYNNTRGNYGTRTQNALESHNSGLALFKEPHDMMRKTFLKRFVRALRGCIMWWNKTALPPKRGSLCINFCKSGDVTAHAHRPAV
jgi:hypothetical protein